jgi:hypothetical protein
MNEVFIRINGETHYLWLDLWLAVNHKIPEVIVINVRISEVPLPNGVKGLLELDAI